MTTSAQAESRRHASAAEVARQEKALLVAAEARARSELEAQAGSAIALQQTMTQLSEAHAGWKASGEEGTARLRSENNDLRRDWVEAKAALGREREAVATVRSEGATALAEAAEATEAAKAESAEAAQEAARLRGQVEALNLPCTFPEPSLNLP